MAPSQQIKLISVIRVSTVVISFIEGGKIHRFRRMEAFREGKTPYHPRFFIRRLALGYHTELICPDTSDHPNRLLCTRGEKVYYSSAVDLSRRASRKDLFPSGTGGCGGK